MVGCPKFSAGMICKKYYKTWRKNVQTRDSHEQNVFKYSIANMKNFVNNVTVYRLRNMTFET